MNVEVERIRKALQTPESLIALIGSNFSSKVRADDPAEVRYSLTVHDLISAFSTLFYVEVKEVK